MAELTRIERLRAAIATEGNNVAWYTREVISGMPVVDVDDMPRQAEAARQKKRALEGELAALRLSLIGGDETFGGGTVDDPHPSKRKGTGMDRLHKQFYIAENGELPELPASGDPGSVLNRYSMTRYFLQGDSAEVILNPKLLPQERDTQLFPILIRLDRLDAKESDLRRSLKTRTAR